MTATIERAAPSLRRDARRSDGTGDHAAGQTAGSPAELFDPPAGAVASSATLPEHPRIAGHETDSAKADAIGDHLTPLPRSTGRAIARGRRRWRSSDRRVPTLTTTLTVSLIVLGLLALLIGSRQRRRGAAERLVRQLERVPSRTPVVDG